MAGYVAIQRSLHLNAGYTPVTDLSFTAGMTTVPLMKEELPFVIQHMAVAFQKRTVGSETLYELVGLQSMSPGKNMFLTPEGRWFSGYMPAFYRAHPFALRSAEQGNQLQLSIKSDCINDQPAETDLRFFEDDNTLTPRMQEIAKFLAESLRSRDVTLKLCKALVDANLIEPWPIKFTGPDENNKPQAKTLEGLFHIDVQALKRLPAEQLAVLNSSGALDIAYGQLFSELRLKDLAALQTAQEELQQPKTRQGVAEPDLDELFGNKDDLFSF